MPAEIRKSEIADYKSWINDLDGDTPRFLHLMLLIADPAASLRFYVDGMGMKLLGSFEVEERRVTAYFVGFEVGQTAVELAHYWDGHEADQDKAGFRHLAFGVPDLDRAVAASEAVGAPPFLGPTKLVEDLPRVAFVRDPDGYSVELFETGGAQYSRR